MEFIEMRDKLMQHFNEIVKDVDRLYEVNVDKEEFWNLYLDSFPVGKNEIYRKRRDHDCSCCRQFIKNIGNAVVIKNNQVETIWDFRTDDDTYQPVLDALSSYIKSHAVSDVYVSKFKKIGTLQNFEEFENGQMHEWSHFFVELPDRLVDKSARSKGEIQGEFRDARNVFKRSLDEINMDALDTVLELIDSNTLYRGSEWKAQLRKFRDLKKEYEKLTDVEKHLFAWEKAATVGTSIGKIRNHSIGTLLVDVSEGMDLDKAVSRYEKIMAPENYKRPKEIFTKRMLDDAKKTIEDLGYMDSLPRRFAKLDDITVNNILFSNKDSAKRITGAEDIFASMENDVVSNPKKFSKVEEIPVEKFLSDVLPSVREVEVYFENKHADNMVSLIAPENRDAKSMFKWNNNFSWAYTGNMADSTMKERVKSAGGRVDGVLRFSIQWNDIDTGHDNNDLDAHCITPNRDEIYFGKKGDYTTLGNLDVDIQYPCKDVAVENITFPDKKRMTPGTYTFYVHQYANRGGRNGFRAEIEFDGQIFSFDYRNELRQGERVYVAEVILNKNGKFSIKEKLSSNVSSKEIWGLKTNQFVPVSVICFSPNWWDDQTGNGNKHLFFMLNGCINDEEPNGMFNEYLKDDLMKHKRVFAALGSKMHVKDCDDQLSGIGFSMTKRNDLIMKVKGNTERILKIKF